MVKQTLLNKIKTSYVITDTSMIILILFTIALTVLARGCQLEYGEPREVKRETIPMVTIDTNYSHVFVACDSAGNGLYEIEYEINNTDTTNVRIYYEQLTVNDIFNNNVITIRKIEMCTGSCTSDSIVVCCSDFKHKLIRVTVENLSNESSVVMNLLYMYWMHVDSCSCVN